MSHLDTSATVALALAEDLAGGGDITTAAVIDPARQGRAVLVGRQDLIVSGIAVAAEVFAQIDDDLRFRPLANDGDAVTAGTALAEVEGSLASMLTAERCCVNFVQHMSGIASLVRRYMDRLEGSGVRLVDTRKTRPGLRSLEKFAVRCGGAHNHRFGLADGVMIKDNHILAAGGITEAVGRALEGVHHLVKIQVEVESLAEANEAIDAGARVLLLDNFDVDELQLVVAALRGRPEPLTLEASGGITLDTVAAVARSGVDVISCGALIHQAQWVDIALDIVPA